MRAWHTVRYKAIKGYYYCERLRFTKEILSLYIKTEPLHLTIQRKLHIWQIFLIFIVRYYTSFKDKSIKQNMQIICAFLLRKRLKSCFLLVLRNGKRTFWGFCVAIWRFEKGGNRLFVATEKLKDDYGLNGKRLWHEDSDRALCLYLSVYWETTERGAK